MTRRAAQAPPPARGRGLGTPLDQVLAAATWAGSRLRRPHRLLHPLGVVADAILTVEGGTRWGASLLDEPGEHRAAVRLSKSAGTPGTLPDVLGLALRLPDAGPVDLLFATTGARPVARWLLRPAGDWNTTYGTLLPYRTGAGHVQLALEPGQPGSVPASLSALRTAVTLGRLSWRLLVATPTGGWERVGVLRLLAPARTDDERPLDFDPVANAVADLVPATAFQRLRPATYGGSRRARRG